MAIEFSSAFSLAFGVLHETVPNISVSNIQTNSITLTANPQGAPEPYRIYWTKSLKIQYVPTPSRIVAQGSTFVDTNVVANTKYYYQCIIIDNLGKKTISDIITVKTLPASSPSVVVDKTNAPSKGPTGVRFDGSTGKFVRF